MGQAFMHYYGDDNGMAEFMRRLEAAGYRVGPANRDVGGVHIRIREGTGDEADVAQIAAEVAPDLVRGPDGSPTVTLVGYREGRS